MKNEIVARVNALKDHQGVLMWDVGNEVILTMQDHGLPGRRGRGSGGWRTRSSSTRWRRRSTPPTRTTRSPRPTPTPAPGPYYKPYSPALDLLAVNSYGAIGTVKQDWINGGYTKPYIVTEAGPDGEWEVPNDVNGVPTEPTDLQKRAQYTASWNAIKGHPGVALGATEFHYGLENDFGGVWLNTTTGGWRRLGYHALQAGLHRAGRRRTPRRRSPAMTVGSTRPPSRPAARSPSSVAATDPNGDPIRYNLMFSNKHINGNRGLDNVRFTQTGTGTFTVTAPEQLGVWKVYVYAFDGQGNVGIEQRSFKVVAPTVAGHQRRARQAGHRVVLPADRHQRPAAAGRTRPTATTAPAGPASGPTRSGSRSTWARCRRSTTSSSAGRRRTPRPTSSRPPTTAPTGRTVYSTTSGDGGFDDLDAQRHRPVRPDERHRARHRYGYSLWEFGVYS